MNDLPNYGDLSTADLVKQINDEYSVILAGDRNTFQKALPIGAKLVVLLSRIKHGERKARLAELCPKVSYETATLYMRFANKLDELTKRAAAKGVTLQELTINTARKLLANPKQATKTKNKNKNKNAQAGAVEEPGDTKTTAVSAKSEDTIRNLAADELFNWVKQVWDIDKVRELSRLLQAHVSTLPMLRRPIGQVAAPPPT
jgi:hypothetical protein